MANYEKYIKRFMNFSAKTAFKDITTKKDPDEFVPNGSQIYYGYQGEGKTISMYYHFTKLKKKYPKTLLVTNLHIKNMKAHHVKNMSELESLVIDKKKEYILFEKHSELIMHLANTRNGKEGVIFMIDEIHNYFHSHDSKSMPMWVVQVFSQQRKQKLIVLGTVQAWDNVIKAIREQIDNLIQCRRIGYLIRNTAYDPRTIEMEYGERKISVKKNGWFFITKDIREGYDTYQIINSGREIMGGEDLKINVISEQSKNTKGWRR